MTCSGCSGFLLGTVAPQQRECACSRCACGTFAIGGCHHCGRSVCSNPCCSRMVAGLLTCAGGVAEMADREQRQRRYDEQVLAWRQKSDHHRRVHLNRSLHGDDTRFKAQIVALRSLERVRAARPPGELVLGWTLAGVVGAVLLWLAFDRSVAGLPRAVAAGLLFGAVVGAAAIVRQVCLSRSASGASRRRQELEPKIGCGDTACRICHPDGQGAAAG